MARQVRGPVLEQPGPSRPLQFPATIRQYFAASSRRCISSSRQGGEVLDASRAREVALLGLVSVLGADLRQLFQPPPLGKDRGPDRENTDLELEW